MKKLKAELISSIKNKRLNVFLLFLVSAFVILIFTKLSKEYTNTVVFNIENVNVPEDKVIRNDSSNILKVTLKTHGFKWLKYYFSKPKIAVDFSSEVYRRKNSFVYTKSISYVNEKKQFQNEVKILNINPDTLVFRYDTNLVKTIPVEAETNITFAPGFDVIEGYKTEPDSITVIGPKAIVKGIDKLKTEQVNLSEVKSDIDVKAKLVLPEHRKELKFSVESINIKADIERFTEGTVKIPVHVVNLPEGVSIKYFPKVLKVSFYTSLKDFNTITAKDFKIVCDYQKVNEQQSFLIAELVKQPKSVKRVKFNQQHIEFIILE